MPNDLVVQPLTAVRTGTEGSAEAKPAANQPLPQPERAANPSPIPNPSLRLDSALGLVVLEFRSDTGVVTKSIPSQRQLQAYQKWAATHAGPTPFADSAALAPATSASDQRPPAPNTAPAKPTPVSSRTSSLDRQEFHQ
jgi:hypothetical protein